MKIQFFNSAQEFLHQPTWEPKEENIVSLNWEKSNWKNLKLRDYPSFKEVLFVSQDPTKPTFPMFVVWSKNSGEINFYFYREDGRLDPSDFYSEDVVDSSVL